MVSSILFRGLAAILLAAAGATAAAQSFDVDEPNDTADEATAVGRVGFLRTGRALTVDDEDWYRFDIARDGGPVTVEVAFDVAAYGTVLDLEVRTLDGSVVATGSLVDSAGPYRAVTAPLAAGEYLVRVRHSGGGDLYDYSIRSYTDDDADEPNDTASAAVDVGPAGFVRAARVLNFGDDDWYRFEVLRATGHVTVDLAFDTAAYDTSLTLQVETLGGALLATGSLVAPEGPYRAVTGPLSAGTYLVRVSYADGSALDDYSIRTSVEDDEDEANDWADAATAVGPVGFIRPARVLDFDDEDWFRFDVLAAGGPVTVDVAYDPAAYHSSVTLEVKTLSGDVVATGALASASGPFRAVTAPLGAGTYLVRLRHDGGDAISDYSLQAYAALTMSAPSYTESSAGAALDIAVDIHGGIKPYMLGIDDRFVAPPGLVFDAVSGRVTGVPALPGRYDFMLTCRDSGSPANTVSVLTTLVVNAQLDVRLGEFTAFALDRSASRAVPSVGGTAPFTIATTLGNLPHGVSFVPGGLAFDGTADGASADSGSAAMAIRVTDAAGLSDSVTTTCVVCSPLGTFHLAEGHAASGVYFDALAGSVVTIDVATVKRQAKRPLRLVLLGTDGSTSLPATLRAGNGSGAVTRFEVPSTGRYYLVAASDAGAATQLVAKGRIAPPKHGSGRADAFRPQDRVSIAIGALEGAVLSFSAKPDKSGLELRVQGLIDPDGVATGIDPGDVKVKSGSVAFSKTLDKSGTWTVVLVGARGGPGKMSYTYKLAQPKGAVYSADE